jgi:hypothetical protein
MSDPTQKDCYTAQEVFSLFYDWYWRYEPERTVLTSDGAPLSPEDQAAYVLLRLFVRGEIEPLAPRAKKPSSDRLYRIAPDQISKAGFPDRPFYSLGCIAQESPLADGSHTSFIAERLIVALVERISSAPTGAHAS